MRRLSLLFAVVFVMPLFGYDSPKEYDDKMMATNSLEGTWRLTEKAFDGRKTEPIFETVVTYRSGIVTCHSDHGTTTAISYRIDSTRKPPHLDVILPGGFWTIRCVYQVDGDRLRIANMFYLKDMRRPQGFNDGGVIVQTYQRVK